MKKVVEQKQVVVSQAKQDCEELLVQIVQDKRVADEQEKQVNSMLTLRGIRLSREGRWCVAEIFAAYTCWVHLPSNLFLYRA